MGKTSTYRPSVIVQKVMSVVPAGSTNYTVDLPAGAYRISLAVDGNFGGAGVLAVAPFTDEAQTSAGAAYSWAEGNDTAIVTAIVANNTDGVFQMLGNAFAAGPNDVIVLPFGAQLQYTIGGGTATNVVDVVITAVRVG